jgi:signal transduction histidine kinase
MSKIFDANSVSEMVMGYWKQSVALGTVWLNKYRDDPFFHTEVNIVALQIAFALVILGLVGTSFSLLYHDIATAIVQGMQSGASAHTSSVIAPSIVDEIQRIRGENLFITVSIIVLMTVLFGYIVARITLSPTRNALKAQKQFIGNIAHELRTPLSVIKTNVEVALMEDKIPVPLKDTLESIVEELDRVSEIINNLLSLSALVKPEGMEFGTVDLGVIAAEAVQKFSPLTKRNQLQVELRRSPECKVWGNATALLQVVSNLVKNAVQYTPRGGSIRITIEPATVDHVELRIQDSGIGIARKDLFRIFEPFYRADPSRTRGYGGSGLGLAIVSELVKIHHGRITMRSALGRGTTVSILFPSSTRMKVGQEARANDLQTEVAVDFSHQ